jgi:Domain of unknown function (DUF4365)
VNSACAVFLGKSLWLFSPQAFSVTIREYDYGVDGSFDEVVVCQNRRVESGFSLSFQLQASTQWQINNDRQVVYDLEVKTYNDLILRRSIRAATLCILILLALPSKDDYEDTPYLLAKAVNLISVMESVSFQEIVKAIDASAHFI